MGHTLSKVQISHKIQMGQHLFLRDPEHTDLGRRMVSVSIKLMDELGFEKFTFRKLAQTLNSTEASVYRYFENKHQLLLYLVSWYWNWLTYQIDYHTHNLTGSKQKLQLAIQVLAKSVPFDPHFSYIDEEALGRIVIAESSKAYLTKEFSPEIIPDLFSGHRLICHKLVGFLNELNPTYATPLALANTIVHNTHRQIFYSIHLPFLTEIRTSPTDKSEVVDFISDMVFKILQVSD